MVCKYCGEIICLCKEMIMQIVLNRLIGNKLIDSMVFFDENSGKYKATQKWVNEKGKFFFTCSELKFKFISENAFLKISKNGDNMSDDESEEFKEKLDGELDNHKKSKCVYFSEEKIEDGSRGDCLPRTDGLSDEEFKEKLDDELNNYHKKSKCVF
jgi:hypothetical protein